MGVGAVFILLIVLIAFAVLGALFYGLFAWLRHLKLDPEQDKLEGGPPVGPQREQSHPRHVRHGRSQRARFIGSR